MFFVSKKYHSKSEGFTPPPGIEPGSPYELRSQGGCSTIVPWRLASQPNVTFQKSAVRRIICLDSRIKKICYFKKIYFIIKFIETLAFYSCPDFDMNKKFAKVKTLARVIDIATNPPLAGFFADIRIDN